MESENITRLDLDGREIILIGTAHVSARSVEEVKNVIAAEQPDTVCVELDAARYESITQKDKWQNTDLVKVIRSGRAGMLFANIILSNYQRRLAGQFHIETGQEMLQGIASARDCGAELVLADRSIQVTFLRIWHHCSFTEKCKLLMTLLMSLVDDEAISEEELEKLKTQDMLQSALTELGGSFKGLKTCLVDERDQYLAGKIRTAPGSRIVAVLGAAHVPGVLKQLQSDAMPDLSALEATPPRSKWGKVLGWSIPVLLVLLVAITFFIAPDLGVLQARNWLILTCALAGLGALISGAHILSVLTAVVMAPISALSPVLAAGWFSGIAEAHFRKPKVEDFENLPRDLVSLKGIWKNKVTKVLLVVILTNVGCAIGNITGSLNVISIFMQAFS